jgi:DNA-binding response OmpR family regulator
MAGFDDVVDITNLHGDEFIARCSAMTLRAAMASQLHIQDARHKINLNAICLEAQLSARHKHILSELLSSKNNTVSFEFLCQSLSLTDKPISLGQMRVLVCQLRKLLRQGVVIESLARLGLPGKGYKLLLDHQYDN